MVKAQSAILEPVIKICISRFYKSFDEVVDCVEVIPPQPSTSPFTVVDSNEPMLATPLGRSTSRESLSDM
jgi:hypothetical protein